MKLDSWLWGGFGTVAFAQPLGVKIPSWEISSAKIAKKSNPNLAFRDYTTSSNPIVDTFYSVENDLFLNPILAQSHLHRFEPLYIYRKNYSLTLDLNPEE